MGFLGLSLTSDLRKEQYKVECLKKDLELLKSSSKKKLEDETKYLKIDNKEKADLILGYGKELKEIKDRIEEIKTQKEQLSAHLTSLSKENELLTTQAATWSKRVEMSASIIKYLFGNIEKDHRLKVKDELEKQWGLHMDFDPDKVEEPEKEEKKVEESIMDKDDVVTSPIVVPEKPKRKTSPKKKTPKE